MTLACQLHSGSFPLISVVSGVRQQRLQYWLHFHHHLTTRTALHLRLIYAQRSIKTDKSRNADTPLGRRNGKLMIQQLVRDMRLSDDDFSCAFKIVSYAHSMFTSLMIFHNHTNNTFLQ